MSDFADGVTINVNGTPATITAAEQQADHAVIRYTITPEVQAGDTVTFSYHGGHIVAADGGEPLGDVEAQEVTNNVTPVLPHVASAALLRDWRASDFSGLTNGTPIPNEWISHDTNAHVLARGAGSTGLIASDEGTTNNKTYVELNGIDDWLIEQGCADLDNLDSFAVFVASDFSPCQITKMNNTSNGGGWALYGAGTSGLIQVEGGANWIGKDVEAQSTISGISTLEVISRSELHVYTDNDNSTETNSSNPPVDTYATTEPLQVGRFGNYQNFKAGWIYGILIYSPAPSATDRAAIVQWMTDNLLGVES